MMERDQKTTEPSEEGRKLIGRAIIDGLLSPGIGGIVLASTYNQSDGGYWQGSGGSHTQGSGDYHQGD
ncbi:MAG: hypothetical protein IID37_12480 [Planctomycetes bacterium]|nr:hypothetical protein [Planctomycetota bacterium]